MATPENDSLLKACEKMMAKERKKPFVRTIHGGKNVLEAFHSSLGDDGFKSMLTHNQIMTNTEGADYVENFLKEQKEKR